MTDEQARCRCGHRLYDHLGPRGRCNEGTKRCRCGAFNKENTVPAFQNVEIERDRFGRPMVSPPTGKGKKVPYRRCTTFVGVLEDMHNLMAWKARQVAFGLGQRSDLVLAAAAADPGDKKKLNEITEKALEAAKSGAAADIGTALHSFTERIDRGQELGAVPEQFRADLDAYKRATEGIEWTAIETFRVHDEYQVAGTADRIGIINGRPMIADIKTGSIDYAAAKIAMQLAMYSRSVPYDIATDKRITDAEPVDPTRGVIIHLPAGQGRCELVDVDIARGWAGCRIAKQVWEWRSIKGLTEPLSLTPPAPPTWESLTCAAATVEDLRLIWKRAKECGAMTDALAALLTARSRELAA